MYPQKKEENVEGHLDIKKIHFLMDVTPVVTSLRKPTVSFHLKIFLTSSTLLLSHQTQSLHVG